MFYTEEDVGPAIAAARELFGPVGAMSENENYLKNVAIAAREFGKLWYGDVSKDTIKEKCAALRTRINQKIYVFDLNNNFEYTDITCCSDAPLTIRGV
jgi:hypothetical protein